MGLGFGFRVGLGGFRVSGFQGCQSFGWSSLGVEDFLCQVRLLGILLISCGGLAAMRF